MQANLGPALCVAAVMVGLVFAYFYAPVARPFFNVLSDWNVRGSLTFSFVAMGTTVGGLTEAFTVYLHKGGRWPPYVDAHGWPPGLSHELTVG